MLEGSSLVNVSDPVEITGLSHQGGTTAERVLYLSCSIYLALWFKWEPITYNRDHSSEKWD